MRILATSDWFFPESSPGRGFASNPQNIPLDGAKCTARNDKGTWETTAPGTVEVATGGGPLIVECSYPGYRTAQVEMKKCVGRRMRSTAQGAWFGMHLLGGMGSAGVIVAPVVVVGALAGSMATGAAVGYAVAGPDVADCEITLELPRK